MADGLVWAVSLFTLMGNNSRNATNFLGQVVGIVGLLIALGQIVKIAPICINAVTGSGSFVGRYPIESRHHRNHDGHTIILGSPCYYHLNHFTGGLDFEREASDVVVFLEDAKVLAHLRRLLDLKDASLFRSRVFLIKGTAFQHYDCRRACSQLGEDAALLPFQLEGSVQQGLLLPLRAWPGRTAACCRGAQRASQRGADEGPPTRAPFAATAGLGAFDTGSQSPYSWEVLPDMQTSDVVRDDQTNIMRTYAMCAASPRVRATCLLHSSQHSGSVLSGSTPNSYFVSIDAVKMGMMGKACMFPGAIAMICNLCVSVGEVLINPGPDYELRIVEGRTAGVFVAPELDAIEQVAPGEDPKISRSKMPKKLPVFEKAQNKATQLLPFVCCLGCEYG
eukprot:g32796.t1